MAEAGTASDIDLIPAEYRARVAVAHTMRTFVAVVVTVVVIGAAAFGGLRYARWEVEKDIEKLQRMTIISTQQRDQITSLRQLKEELDGQLGLLGQLRSGGEAQRMSLTLDRALPEGEVWFLKWSFKRAGFVTGTGQKTETRGYFIVVPKDADQPAAADAMKVETHMDVNGQSRDHAALSKFVRRLFEQPEIQDVRVVSTALRRYPTASVVDFNLAIVVRRTTGPG